MITAERARMTTERLVKRMMETANPDVVTVPEDNSCFSFSRYLKAASERVAKQYGTPMPYSFISVRSPETALSEFRYLHDDENIAICKLAGNGRNLTDYIWSRLKDHRNVSRWAVFYTSLHDHKIDGYEETVAPPVIFEWEI
jgi:hypothetical protein